MKDKDPIVKKPSSRQITKYIRLYVIPIFAIVFFLVILIALTIPKISEIFSSLDLIAENNTEIMANNAEITKLNTLTERYNILVSDLAIIDGIAPVGNTEVVRFRDRISDLIQSNNLSIISQRLSEANAEIDSTNKLDSPIILQEVPFLFTVQGSFNDIVSFIQALNTVEDFLVVKELQLSSMGGLDTNNRWELKINIVKYQFNSPSNDSLRALYTSVPIEASLNPLMEKYIASRSDIVTDSNSVEN
ncbi:hypothetical protein DOJK_01961 [Patescibacteria group bacterium]|jgi:hypothetical protein|nr:hypothetical protein DOJK_01961 [Patescibacteria group bacterium]